MTTMYLFLLGLSALVVVGLLAAVYSSRVGLSHLLVFLVVGMLAGVDGPLGLRFDNAGFAFAFGNMALLLILLDGGLRTPAARIRQALGPAGLLATAGVGLTAALTGAFAMLAFGMDWRYGLLLGAIVAPTDAAAVFYQIGRSGVAVPDRLAATVEVESGLNDPVAIVLTLGAIELILAPAGDAWALLRLGVQQIGLGLVIGLGAGWIGARALARLPQGEGHGGRNALLLAASGTMVFALTGLLDGSGFLAVYLFGVVLATRARSAVQPVLPGMNGYTWLAEATLFLLLGLLVTPHEVWRFAGPALVVTLGLTLLARPIAVALCLGPLGFTWREQVFVSWAGLRGAVPILLALYPVIREVEGAYLVFDTAFFVVLCSLLFQAPSMGWAARRLGLRRDA